MGLRDFYFDHLLFNFFIVVNNIFEDCFTVS